jgi:hypothetical protein
MSSEMLDEEVLRHVHESQQDQNPQQHHEHQQLQHQHHEQHQHQDTSHLQKDQIQNQDQQESHGIIRVLDQDQQGQGQEQVQEHGHHVQHPHVHEVQHQLNQGQMQGQEQPLIVAVEGVHGMHHSHPHAHTQQHLHQHQHQHPIQSQPEEPPPDMDGELAKKFKKQKKMQSSKKSNSMDSSGNPVEKRKSVALQLAQEIVQRYRERGNVLPKEWIQRKGNPEREQEYRDKNKLRKWRQSLDGNYKGNICFEEIKQYLDLHMPDWSQGRQAKFRPTMEAAQGIIERYYARGSVLPHVQLPREAAPSQESSSAADQSLTQSQDQVGGSSQESSQRPTSLEEGGQSGTNQNVVVDGQGSSTYPTPSAAAQETHDAEALSRWRLQYNRSLTRKKKSDSPDTSSDAAFDSVRELLDQHIPNWRESFVEYGDPNASIKTPRPRHNVDPMLKATEIVRRYKERGNVLPKEWNDLKGNPDRMQEYKDASKLRKWRQALNGVKSVSTICPDFLQEYLDAELANWRYSVKNKHGGSASTSGTASGEVDSAGGDKRHPRKRKRVMKENEEQSLSHHVNSQLLQGSSGPVRVQDSSGYVPSQVLLEQNSGGMQLDGRLVNPVGQSGDHHHLQHLQQQHEQHQQHQLLQGQHQPQHHQLQQQQPYLQPQQHQHQHHHHHHHDQHEQHHHHHQQHHQHHEQQGDDDDDDDEPDQDQIDMSELVKDIGNDDDDDLGNSDDESSAMLASNIMTIASEGKDLVYGGGHHGDDHGLSHTGDSMSDTVGTNPKAKRGRDTYEVTDTVQI